MKLVAFPVIVIIFAVSVASAKAEDRFLTSGTARARALAMGGAFHSVEDDFSAAFYNPGAFKMYAAKAERPFRILLNPAATAAGMHDYSRYDYDYDRDDELTVGEALYSLAFLVKGITLSTSAIDFGIGLGEEIIKPNAMRTFAKRVYSFEGLSEYQFHSAFLNVKIADPVSFGVSGDLYQSRIDEKTTVGNGYSFGVLLKPDPRLNIGIAYHQMPEDFSDARLGLERIETESATAGISYKPNDQTILSIDVRAVNEEDLDTSRQIHAGIERRFADRIALRGGFYHDKQTDDNVISCGIGILPRWEKTSKYSGTTRNDVLSYTLIAGDGAVERRWHIISLLLRL